MLPSAGHKLENTPPLETLSLFGELNSLSSLAWMGHCPHSYQYSPSDFIHSLLIKNLNKIIYFIDYHTWGKITFSRESREKESKCISRREKVDFTHHNEMLPTLLKAFFSGASVGIFLICSGCVSGQ